MTETGVDRARRLRVIGVIGCISVIGVPTALGQTVEEFTGDPAAGRLMFVARGCVRCHSIWGNGGTLGPDLALVGAGRSLLQLAGLFWNHTPRMIETVRREGVRWATFTAEELADVISYIYYVKLFDSPGDSDLGERWYREKRCADCHTVGGLGGSIGPALDGYAQYIAPIVLAEGMWNHGPAMRQQQAARAVAMPTFSGRELADLQAYIRKVSLVRRRRVQLLEPPNPTIGRRLFVTKACVQCHGAAGRGTQFGPDLRAATQRLRVSEIAGELWNHSATMSRAMQDRGIPFPRFEGSEMADIIAFLYYLRFYDTGGSINLGARAFVEKGCSGCHALGAAGSVGPDLSASGAVLAPLALATAMWNHAPAMYDRAQLAGVDWPRFVGEEMRDLVAYLRSLESGTPE